MNIEGYFCTIIDGPNFINRLLEHDYTKDYILNGLSLALLYDNVSFSILSESGHPGKKRSCDFYCSNKTFGPKNNGFTSEETKLLLEKFKKEPWNTVHQIDLPSEKEKGVDVSVVTRMFEMQDLCDTIILVSSDKDYVPALEALKRKGKYIVTAGFDDHTHPIELRNVSYSFVDINECYTNPFKGYLKSKEAVVNNTN